MIFTHGGEPREWEGYFGLPRDGDGMGRPQELAPLACIPTTAGTGSEVSFAAVIKDRDEHVKFQIGDFPMYPRLALLDPASTAHAAPADRRGHRHGRDDATPSRATSPRSGTRTPAPTRCRRCG